MSVCDPTLRTLFVTFGPRRRDAKFEFTGPCEGAKRHVASLLLRLGGTREHERQLAEQQLCMVMDDSSSKHHPRTRISASAAAAGHLELLLNEAVQQQLIVPDQRVKIQLLAAEMATRQVAECRGAAEEEGEQELGEDYEEEEEAMSTSSGGVDDVAYEPAVVGGETFNSTPPLVVVSKDGRRKRMREEDEPLLLLPWAMHRKRKARAGTGNGWVKMLDNTHLGPFVPEPELLLEPQQHKKTKRPATYFTSESPSARWTV